MSSVWKEIERPSFPVLKSDIKTDVLIIGGGMSGLLCAHFLKNKGISCTVVEEKRICSGVTGSTTAKITAQHGPIYQKLLKKYGADKAKMYYKANNDALNLYKNIASNIECDFELCDSYLYRRDVIEQLETELNVMEQLGIPARWEEAQELPISTVGAICMPNQGKFHPLKFAAAIAEKLDIYENTPVISYQGNAYCTPNGKINAKKTIVATHFPIWNKHGLYPVKMYQERSYVLALSNVQKIRGMYMDGDKKGLSFRQADDLLLLGGGNHRTGKRSATWPESEAKVFYPNSKIIYKWATQDCITLDGMPYIGQYATHTPDLYVATGFNKWGMTGSMVAAQLLSDLILGCYNPYEDLFSPQRSLLHPQLAANVFETTLNLLKPKTPRCPHLGCALTWNKAEHSWDCPCHGSRFSEDGEKLDTPANENLRYNCGE